MIDGDNDPFTTSTVLELVDSTTSFFTFDDDGPVLDIGVASGTALDLDMDEFDRRADDHVGRERQHRSGCG